MTVEQLEASLMELREECNPRKGTDNPVTVFLMSDAAVAWLAQQLFNRQERAIEVRLMEAEAYGPH